LIYGWTLAVVMNELYDAAESENLKNLTSVDVLGIHELLAIGTAFAHYPTYPCKRRSCREVRTERSKVVYALLDEVEALYQISSISVKSISIFQFPPF
jgi:hypothetical protein